MEYLHFDIVFLWGVILAVGVAMYVILDGFDLGIGILFPFAHTEEERDTMMNSIAPVWDGNETWLILGGAGLLAAFPKVYSIILPVLYIPLTLFLVALIFRGIAFEFRFKSHTRKELWNSVFAIGSTLATFCQGIVLGIFVQGFDLKSTGVITSHAWLTPFSLLTGVALVCGYALLGSTWLITKTTGPLQNRSYRWSKHLFFLIVFFIGLVSIWTPFAEPEIAARWFSWPKIIILGPVPLLTLLLAFLLWNGLNERHEKTPFIFSIALFLLSYVGLGISIWPYIIPRHMTLWEATAPYESQLFALVGVLIFLPFVLGYTIYVYRVFRGKVTEGYGH